MNLNSIPAVMAISCNQFILDRNLILYSNWARMEGLININYVYDYVFAATRNNKMRSYIGLLLRNDMVRSPTRLKLRIEAENYPHFRQLTLTFLCLVPPCVITSLYGYKLEIFWNSCAYLAKISLHGVSIFMKAQLAGWGSLRALVDSESYAVGRLAPVGPPMPDRFWARRRTKKDTSALKVGGLSWDWYLHLLKTELSRNPGYREVMAPENELIGRSITDPPPVLSPSSILHPPSSHCTLILARKNSALVLKIHVFFFFFFFFKTLHNSETA